MLLLEKISHEELVDTIKEFYLYATKHLNIDRAPKIKLIKDQENADSMLGKTGYYDPDLEIIALFITDRHPKDIIRSFSHELIHHEQKCRGSNEDIDMKITAIDPAYASHDPKLREMEREAFERGNMLFRDWCDMKKIQNKENDMSESKLKESKMPMKKDIKDVDGDGNTSEKVPAFLDPGDVKKKKSSGKIPKQLKKFVKKKAAGDAKEESMHRRGDDEKKLKKEDDSYTSDERVEKGLEESVSHPYPELFQKKERIFQDRFKQYEEMVYQELLKKAIK